MIHSAPATMKPDTTEPRRIEKNDNGGPPITEAKAERPKVKTEPFGLRAAWLRFAEEVELRRLAVMHYRIERKQEALAVMIAERQRIMNRCIRRMRRKDGKN